MHIDLNADVGEGSEHDAALLALVTSVNIACGGHAGDADTMRATVRAALAQHVAIGAHPSFPDREHFGRRELQLPLDRVHAAVLDQIGALAAVARAESAVLAHVKPHGALYNQAARDRALADTIAAAVRAVDPALRLVGLAGSELIHAGRRAGLAVFEEGFADRRYNADGTLVSRTQAGAIIDDPDAAIAQTLAMIQTGTVTAGDGSTVPVHADTIGLHGDGPQALPFAQALRRALADAGIAVRSPGIIAA